MKFVVWPARRSRSAGVWRARWARDRKSTRLNSSHSQISYAVFCLKKKKKQREDSNTYTITDQQYSRFTHPSHTPILAPCVRPQLQTSRATTLYVRHITRSCSPLN